MSSIDLEYVNCILCGEDKTELLFTVRDEAYDFPGGFNVVKCCNCGLVYLNPRPTKDTIGNYYPKGYGTQASKLNRALWKLQYIWSRLFTRDLPSLNGIGKGRVLDVGCGWSMFLKVWQDEGWETYGVDIDPSIAKQARILGVNIFVGELYEANFQDGYFDVVVMNHSLEHMADPLAVLMEVRRVMKADGTLIIGVPNIGSRSAKIFGRYWTGIDAPRHFYCFTPHTLKLILEKAGFNIGPINYFYSSQIGSLNNYLRRRLGILDNAVAYALLYPLFAVAARVFHEGDRMSVRAKKSLGQA